MSVFPHGAHTNGDQTAAWKMTMSVFPCGTHTNDGTKFYIFLMAARNASKKNVSLS